MEIKQCVGCTRQFFTKSFLSDGAAVLVRSSGTHRKILISTQVRRNLDVLTTQLPQLDVTTENVILDDDELFAYLPLEDSIL